MGLLSKLLNRQPKPRERSLFEIQCQYEEEGAAAGLLGKTRDDCPYDPSQETEWNFWVYGCDNARGEVETLKLGTVKMMCVGGPPDYKLISEWEETTEQAYRNGNWKPRYVAISDEWKHG